MLSKFRKKWREFKALPEGQRFQSVHEQQKDAPKWVKPVVIAGAVVSFAIGVLLSVLPGPAFVFFGLTGALLAVESAWVAGVLDRGEVAMRGRIAQLRRWRAKRRGGARRKRRQHA